MALIEPSLDILLEAGMEAIRAKSVLQTDYLVHLWENLLKEHGFSLNSPRESHWRGSHISLGHPYGLGIDLAMIRDKRIIPDFRPPDNIRLGIAPLYVSFADIHTAISRMRNMMERRLYEGYAGDLPTVT
jgi:kynureninase